MAGAQIKSANLAKVSEIDFVDQFSKSVQELQDILGITRMVEKVPGQLVKVYKVTGTLESGTVAEGTEIPLSSYASEVSQTFELTIDKYRKQTTIEAINDKGYQQAVIDTDAAMVSDVQGNVLTNWYTFLSGGSGRSTAAGKGLRGALAKTRAKLRTVLKSYNVSADDLVYFVNEDDVADYLSDANNYASIADAFGMQYVEKFLGLYNVIVAPDVKAGTVYGTPKNNVIMYYTNPANSDIAAAFDFEVDETGLIGVAHNSKYSDLTTDTIVICGMKLYAEFETFIVQGKINPADPITIAGEVTTKAGA